VALLVVLLLLVVVVSLLRRPDVVVGVVHSVQPPLQVCVLATDAQSWC
jgi:hypothetical protein